MRRPREPRELQRSTRFETFEERLALSSQPVDDFLLEAHSGQRLEHHYGDLAPAESVAPVGDFNLNLGITSPADNASRGVQTHLSEAHNLTGVNDVYNTYGFDGAGQTVAIIDSGIAYDHYALGAGFGTSYRVVGGWDFAENDANPYDDGPAGFHGTHVAGIVGSDNVAHRGVASGADLVALRVFDDNGAGYFSWVEDALRWVHDNRDSFENPITTVNLSLGTNWNADSIPSWAMLEDEFAQLELDGIFTSVSAGNSFVDFNAPGLSYPAASSHVVPVASVDDTGLLSYFSQRNDRVLAAPGRSITSTVPDYIFGADGNPNDFGTASGTSMAAPYTAGASALVRQAMEFVGIQNITQDTIYDHFRATADNVFDAATNATYHRINVLTAIDALVPPDDYGSDAKSAFDLGTLSGTSTLSGHLGMVTDWDFFTFSAGETGTISFAIDTNISTAINVQLIDGTATFEDNVLTFDVVAGESYTIALGANGVTGDYSTTINLEEAFSSIDVGLVDFTQIMNQEVNGKAWYAIDTARSGILTVEAFFDRVGGDIRLEVYDAEMQMIDSSTSLAESERVDVQVSSSTSYVICVNGGNTDFDLRMSNLVSSSGGAFSVFGTNGNDSIVLDLAARSLTIKGVDYSFAAGSINIEAGDGQDSMTILGSDANETVVFHPGRVDVSNQTVTAYAIGVENVDVYGGDGSGDRAHFYDSNGDDQFIGRVDTAQMLGAGYSNTSHGFDYNYAYASTGSGDRAYFYDSAGDDEFVARPNWARMTGDGFSHYANGFDYNYAYADYGTGDRAYFYDSGGSDEFVGRPNWARMTGDGFSNYANGFDYTYAWADNGTGDRAYFYDSGGSDEFVGRPNWSRMTGIGFSNYANGFDHNYAYAGYGSGDRAYFYGSGGNDVYLSTSQWSRLFGVGFFNEAHGFDYNSAHAGTGGTADRAHFFKSAADEISTGPDWLQLLGDGQMRYGQGFEQIYSCEETEAEIENLAAERYSSLLKGTQDASVDHFFDQVGK